jgi:hypothetical protein
MQSVQTQHVVLPLTYTHVTKTSFKRMRGKWVQDWAEAIPLTYSECAVLDQLAFMVNLNPELGVAFPRQDTLAKRIKIRDRPISRKTVNRAIQELAALGAIEVLTGADRPKKRGRMVNYKLRFDRVPAQDGYDTTSFYLEMLRPAPEPVDESVEDPADAQGNIATKPNPNVPPAQGDVPPKSHPMSQECPTIVPAMSQQCPTELLSFRAFELSSFKYYYGSRRS